VTSLTAIFGGTEERPQQDNEKLLQLYWNRAELKKEFAELRNETFRLQKRIKEREGATARVQQKLEHLEQLLQDPEWVYNVIVYYQLQHLNLQCCGKLRKFAEELKQQREKRLQCRLLDDWHARRAEELEAVQDEVGAQRLQVQMLEDRLQAEQHRLLSASGLVRFFRRRTMTAALDRLADAIDSARQQEDRLLARLEAIQSQQPPDTPGLDVPTKRLINFTILAFAQEIYLHFVDDGLAGLAKEAGQKSVGAIRYGDRKDSERIVEMVHERLESFEKSRDLADVLRQRAAAIADKARFDSGDEAVPASGSVARVFRITARGAADACEVDLLGENYWGLQDIVSR